MAGGNNPFRTPEPSSALPDCECQTCMRLRVRDAAQRRAILQLGAVPPHQLAGREVLGEYTYQGVGLGVYKVRT